MKRFTNNISLFIILICGILLIACSSNSKVSDRIIVQQYGFKTLEMADAIAELNTIESITEISSNVVLCKVIKLNNVSVTQTNQLDFEYEVQIEKVYLNANNLLNDGDIITISSSEGIIKGSEFNKLIKDSKHANKFGYANIEYKENEYITSSYYDAIPIEVGKTYIMYLTDRYYETYKVFAESGRMFLYEYTDEVVYSGSEFLKNDLSFEELETQIYNAIKNRTGRADEIGYHSYLEELGKTQKN